VRVGGDDGEEGLGGGGGLKAGGELSARMGEGWQSRGAQGREEGATDDFEMTSRSQHRETTNTSTAPRRLAA
jgi:hypothetical protein